MPDTYTLHPTAGVRQEGSTAMPTPVSFPLPPRYVEYASVPVESILTTKASWLPPRDLWSGTPELKVGKLDDVVVPTT